MIRTILKQGQTLSIRTYAKVVIRSEVLTVTFQVINFYEKIVFMILIYLQISIKIGP